MVRCGSVAVFPPWRKPAGKIGRWTAVRIVGRRRGRRRFAPLGGSSGWALTGASNDMGRTPPGKRAGIPRNRGVPTATTFTYGKSTDRSRPPTLSPRPDALARAGQPQPVSDARLRVPIQPASRDRDRLQQRSRLVHRLLVL